MLPSKCSLLFFSALSPHSDQNLWYYLTIFTSSCFFFFFSHLNPHGMAFCHLPSRGTAQRSRNPVHCQKHRARFLRASVSPAPFDLDAPLCLNPVPFGSHHTCPRHPLASPSFLTGFSATLLSSPPPANVGLSEELCLCSFSFPCYTLLVCFTQQNLNQHPGFHYSPCTLAPKFMSSAQTVPWSVTIA